MATTDLGPGDPCGINTLNQLKFAKNSNGDIVVRVGDDEALGVLEQILTALGGTPTNNKTQTTFNEVIAAANVEQSLVLPTSICGYLIKTRGNGSLKLTHVSGESGTNYLEIPGKSSYTDDHSFANLTLYFQSPQVGEVVEVVVWE